MAETKTTKIHKRVQSAGGVLKVTLGELRDELGYARIGKKILGTMGEHLSENSLGCFPGWVMDPEYNEEPRQWQEVWIFERDGSAKSAILDAFANPEENDLSAALSAFGGDAPDFTAMDAEQRLAFVKAALV